MAKCVASYSQRRKAKAILAVCITVKDVLPPLLLTRQHIIFKRGCVIRVAKH